MGFDIARRAVASVALAAMLGGCGSAVDSLLTLEDGKDAPSRTAYAGLSKAGNTYAGDAPRPSGLSQVDDPAVFYRTAAEYAVRSHDYEAAVRHYANLTALEPNETAHARNLAKTLRVVGRQEDSERVLRQALREHPNDVLLMEELGKTLMASGQLREGVGMLERLASTPGVDKNRVSRLRSAMGVAFDRAGKHDEAREQYRTALQADPLNASALNNLGLSFAMTGHLDAGEKALRRALIAPNASAQVRQNLAMVLALKGKQSDAVRLARQDLPPSMARDVVGFYTELGNDGALWKNANARQ